MNDKARQKAVLVSVKLPDVPDGDFESSLTELGRLVTTLGYEIVGQVIQAREHVAAAAILGEGKLLELGELTGGTGHVGSTAPKKKDKARLRREERVILPAPDAEPLSGPSGRGGLRPRRHPDR